MSDGREDEDLDHLLGAAAPDRPSPAEDPLTALLHAAAAADDPDRAARGEEAAMAAFREAQRRSANKGDRQPHRRATHGGGSARDGSARNSSARNSAQRRLASRTVFATTVASLALILLAASVLPRAARTGNGHTPANQLSTAPTGGTVPGPDGTSPRPLDQTISVDPLATTGQTPSSGQSSQPIASSPSPDASAHGNDAPGRVKPHKTGHTAAKDGSR